MRTLFAVFFLSVASHSFAQTTIEGKVTGNKGEPIALANIFIVNSYDGTSSADDGTFHFQTSETGTRQLVVRIIGYHDYEQTIVLNGGKFKLEIALKEAISELSAVTISAGSFTASDASRRTVFRAVDIATTAGSTADIAGALNTLPGTQKVGESGRLFVRGGDGQEARTFIDGMVVFNAYSPAAPNTPSRGRYLPFMFKGISFSTGGYSAEYGQALSSALALDSKDESEASRTDISLLSVGGDIAHTMAWEGGSAAAKLQYTNLRPYVGLINQRIDWRSAPREVEGMAAFRQRTGQHGMVKAYGNFSNSDFSFYQTDIDDESIKTLYALSNDYRYANGSYRNAIGEQWLIRGGLSYSSISSDVVVAENILNERENGIHSKAVLEGSIGDHMELKVGAEVLNRDHEFSMRTSSAEAMPRFNETISALFAETDLYASNAFVARLGGRVEHNNLAGMFTADPRISLAYKTSEHGQVSVAYGTFRQSVRNEFLRMDTGLKPEKAEHVILNYQCLADDRTFRVEAFYKNYSDLVKVDTDDIANSTGNGYARGAEIFWRDNKSVKNLDYWVSYSFLDTKRDYLRFPSAAVPSFASRHNFSAVAKYFVRDLKSQLGATWSYGSGRPYNNPNQPVFNNGRTPAFHDLSFNLSYLPKSWLIVYFSCTNLTGRDNIFGYEYSSNLNEAGRYNARAIRQPAPRFVFLGLLITLSKDKSINQLPAL